MYRSFLLRVHISLSTTANMVLLVIRAGLVERSFRDYITIVC